MSRRGRVFVHDVFAGTIEETPAGEYVLRYDAGYLALDGPSPISFTLPLRPEPFVADELFPFFDGLIPEGWLLDLVTRNWKLDRADRMGLLLAACGNCLGAVHVVAEEDDDSR